MIVPHLGVGVINVIIGGIMADKDSNQARTSYTRSIVGLLYSGEDKIQLEHHF